MIPDRVTSNILYHVRTAYGVTIDLTPNYAAASALALVEGARLYMLNRASGRSTWIAG